MSKTKLKVFLIFIFILLRSHVNCQSPTLDSLYGMLEKANTEYEFIDIYLGLTRAHMLGGSTQKAYESASKSLELALQLQSKRQEANTRAFIAMISKSDGKDYCPLLEAAIEVAKLSKDKDAITFTTYPWVEDCVFDTDKAIPLLLQLINNATGQVSQKNLGNTYKTLAWQYELAGRFEEAESANIEAIEIFKNIGLHPEVDPVLGRPSCSIIDGGATNLLQTIIYTANLYIKMGKYVVAVKYGEEGYELGKTMTKSDHAWSAYLLGDIYVEIGELSKAVERYNESVRIYETIDEPGYHSEALSSLGVLYYALREYKEAEKRFVKAHELVASSPNGAAEINVQLGYLYKAMLQPEKSIDSYLKADSLFGILGNHLRRVNCKLAIADAQSDQGFYELAYNLIEQQIPIAEKARDDALLHSIYAKNVQFESTKK